MSPFFLGNLYLKKQQGYAQENVFITMYLKGGQERNEQILELGKVYKANYAK